MKRYFRLLQGKIRSMLAKTPGEQPSLSQAVPESDPSPLDLFLKRMQDLTVGEVMVPRADLLAVCESETLEGVVERFLKIQAEALPVFRNTLDNVVGVVLVHQVLACATRKDVLPWNRHILPVSFVPASQSAQEAFMTLTEADVPFLMIVDEHGGIDGLVSRKALTKALGVQLGLAEEASDILETVALNEQGAYLVDGRLGLSTFEEEFQISLHTAEREEQIETIGGLVCSLAGRVPLVKEMITHPRGVTFEILDADARRIKRMAIILPPDPS